MQSITNILKNHSSAKQIAPHIQQLNKVHSIWQEFTQPDQNTLGVDKLILEKTVPVSIYKNTLYVCCETNMIANHFRFSEETILNFLNKHGLGNVQAIKAFTDFQQFNENSEKNGGKILRKVSPETIQALEQLAATSQSDRLNRSVNTLLTLLKIKTS